MTERKERALVLFKRFPDIEIACKLPQELSCIFDNTLDKTYAFTRLVK